MNKYRLVLVIACAMIFCIVAASSASADTGTSAIKGVVYNDTNQDGQHQINESGIQGITVELLDGDGALEATLVTDHNGYFNFTGLEAGQYTVYVVVPDGYTNSSAKSIAVSLADDSLGKTCIGIYVVQKPPCHKDKKCGGDDNKWDNDGNCNKNWNNNNWNNWGCGNNNDRNNNWNNNWGNNNNRNNNWNNNCGNNNNRNNNWGWRS